MLNRKIQEQINDDISPEEVSLQRDSVASLLRYASKQSAKIQDNATANDQYLKFMDAIFQNDSPINFVDFQKLTQFTRSLIESTDTS